jgi:TonB family protein
MIRQEPIRNLARRAIAAIVLVGAAIIAAAPAVAGERQPQTLAAWRAEVDRQIDATLDIPAGGLRRGDHAVATVLVSLDAEGRLSGVALGRPTGDAAVDEEALRTARAVRYPPLPVGLRGHPRTIAMMLYFGEPGSDSAAIRQVAEAAALAAAAEQRSNRSATAEACTIEPPQS